MEKVDTGKECPLFKDKCVQSFCAWWIKEANECAVVGLAQALDYQAGTLRDILNHM